MEDGHIVVASRARACIGTRFRPQGRLAGVGLDCVGVVAVAWGVEAPVGYNWRSDGGGSIEPGLVRLGFVRAEAARVGDVLVVAPAEGLRHLAVLTEAGTVVHAHAGLRRVVEGPVDPAWVVLGAWRRAEG